jgi:hypothetical protein
VEVQSLDLGDGNVVKLDKLGPMIINSDGVGNAPSTLAEAHMRKSRSDASIDSLPYTELA